MARGMSGLGVVLPVYSLFLELRLEARFWVLFIFTQKENLGRIGCMGVLGCIPFPYSHVIVGGGNKVNGRQPVTQTYVYRP